MNKPKRYSFEGRVALGKLVRMAREAVKPDWEPRGVNLDELTESDRTKLLHQEQGPWTLRQMVDIINREFDLSKEAQIPFSRLQRLESPPRQSADPPYELLVLIASLEIIKGPDGVPYTERDLEAIAQGRLHIEIRDGRVVNQYACSCVTKQG